MTIIHKRERTRVGEGLYLNPVSKYGDGIYMRKGGFIGILPAISTALNFAQKNSGLIKDGIASASSIASAISDIKKAADEAEKLKEIRKIRKKIGETTQPVKEKTLSEHDQQLIQDAINSASVKSGSGLKRF